MKTIEELKNQIICGDCLEVMKDIPDNSIDSIVTDPPYELGFMGKSWDNTGIANNKDMWAECLRVLKPGGHLLAFAGTRTYHRMASAIEDAGFEVRDMIEWVYGCLSEDTEILTESGYKLLRKLTQYDKIAVYDITNNIYKWERPQRWSVYKVHQDTAYRIKSDYTDQIVSRNHRCLVEREGKLTFIQADELSEVEYMPTLSEDFYSLQENSTRTLLFTELLWKGKGLAKKLFSKWKGNKKSEERIEVRKEPSLERWSNLLEETRKLQADKICEVSEGVFTDGEKRWICNGTSFDNGSILGDMFRESPSSASYQSRPTGQPTGKPDVISIKQGTQIIRRARVTKIEYSGIIFCPTVSTGAFIARRNDQVFITGNSGFPKSLNIGKAVARLEGEDIPKTKGFNVAGQGIGLNPNKELRSDHPNYVKPKYDNDYEGWGTALKPAHEPICMARKPLDRWWKIKDDGKKIMGRVMTVAENCLKWGTGGINIDESRVGITPEDSKAMERCNTPGSARHKIVEATDNSFGRPKPNGNLDTTQGRFPANLIHDNSEEVRECFPESNGRFGAVNTGNVKFSPADYGKGQKDTGGIKDSGNASRFFKSILYYPKASKSERNKNTNNYLIIEICVDNTEVAQLQPRVILEKTELWFTELFGKEKMEEYQMDFKSTIKTETKKTTILVILNYSQHLNIKEYIVGAIKTKTENGGSPVASVANISEWRAIITDELMAYLLGVNPVVSPTQLRISVNTNNFHSTVKPIALMEYLIKMVTPKGGLVLDPFAGSGSTLVAAKQNGFQYIGIELTEEYIPIIEARLNSPTQDKLL